MNNKYQNGKIYAIKSSQTDKVYYGSTTLKLSKRLALHKKDFSRYQQNQFNRITSFDIVQYEDCYIELVEYYPCESRQALELHEGEIIKTSTDAVNKIVAGRTRKQYRLDNSNKIRDNKKQYYLDNADIIKDNNKQYYWDNHNTLRAKQKQYYLDNADRILKPYVCACGCSYVHCSKARHLKSNKHNNWMKTELDKINDIHNKMIDSHKNLPQFDF